MRKKRAHDVCVIGGGPAGAVAAIQAARKGHRVCLVEKSSFPRPRVGEALSIGAGSLLASLGLEACLERALFARSREVRMRWETEEVRTLVSPHPSFLVNRSVLDTELLSHAAKVGVEVVQPAVASAIKESCGWTIAGKGIKDGQLRTRTVIDAGGRSAWRPSRRTQWAPPSLGIWSAFAHELPVSLFLEAMADGWLWAAPVARGQLSVVFVTDSLMGTDVSVRRPADFLRAQLRQSRLLGALADAPCTRPVVVCDATPSSCANDVNSGLILAGEAAVTLDPLSGSGIEHALRSGIYAAAAIHTLLRQPNQVELCERFLRDRQRETTISHLSWAGEAYASVVRYAERPFWAARARPGALEYRKPQVNENPLATPDCGRVRLAAGVRFSKEACIEDGVIMERPCICGPSLKRPVSFVDGVNIVPLLACLANTASVDSLLSLWSENLLPAKANRVLNWLVQHQLLCTA